MTPLHEARFYEPLADKKVLCTLCPHDCRIPNNGRGACSVRYNRDGRLYTLVYDKVVARNLEPIEKKPLFHFHPGSTAYSIATVGCCLRCAFCQNWQISQWPQAHLPKRINEGGNEQVRAAGPPELKKLAHQQRCVVDLRRVGQDQGSHRSGLACFHIPGIVVIAMRRIPAGDPIGDPRTAVEPRGARQPARC